MAIIRVSGGVFTSERVRQYLAAFGRPISTSYGLWHVEIERRLFFGGGAIGQGDIRSGILVSPTETLVRGSTLLPQKGDEIAKKGA